VPKINIKSISAAVATECIVPLVVALVLFLPAAQANAVRPVAREVSQPSFGRFTILLRASGIRTSRHRISSRPSVLQDIRVPTGHRPH
jgi:hypothetical protein